MQRNAKPWLYGKVNLQIHKEGGSIARWENEYELKNYSHFEYIIVDIKGNKFLIRSVEKGPLYKALLRHKAGISSAHHLSGVALMPNSIMEMKPSPLVELYIDELKAVKQGATIPYEAYLAAKKESASPQVESDSSLLFLSEDGNTEAENTSAITVYGEIVLIGGRDMANEMIEAGSVYDRDL